MALVPDPRLRRVPPVVLAELDTTVPSGFTGKWAEAAWAQVALGGMREVAVRGDVERLSVGDVAEYVRTRVPIGPAVEIVCAGPVEPSELLGEAQRVIGRLERREAIPRPKPQVKRPYGVGDVEATWDIDAKHYLEWYPLEESSAAARAVLAMHLQTEMVVGASGPDVPVRQQRATVSLIELSRPGVLFSVPIGGDGEVAAARESVQGALERTQEGVLLPSTIAATIAQVSGPPDLDAMRERFAGRPNADLLEAQVALDLVYRERRARMPLPELARALRTLDADDVRALAKALREAKRSSLSLTPSS